MVGLPSISWKVPSWATSTASEDVEDVDEPPELQHDDSPTRRFRKTSIRRPSEQTSLLTKAIMSGSEQDSRQTLHSSPPLRRRRSVISIASVASTADLTSDTGFTSPARTNTPSPPIPDITVSRLHPAAQLPKKVTIAAQAVVRRPDIDGSGPLARDGDKSSQTEPRKRSIQFACNSRPAPVQNAVRPSPAKAPSALETPRRPCIKFACPSRPASTQNTPPRQRTPPARSPKLKKASSPSTPKRTIPASPGTPRPSSSHKKATTSASGGRPKFLRANSNDLVTDGSQFHEFACERSREDDWIRQDCANVKCKLTIDDTLTKENEIRRLAKEAEEEAELEEEEEEEDVLDEDDEDEDEDEDDVDSDADDEDLAHSMSDDDASDCGLERKITAQQQQDALDKEDAALSDGYHTDEETGFADSDESDAEEDGNMALWTLSKSPTMRPSTLQPLARTKSLPEQHSDSSSTSTGSGVQRRSKVQRIKPKDAPDLPDSTDFVCGTLDEDRPLEEAYLSCMAARRNEKLRIIPQDIDPSFPTSEPEDEEDEDIYNPVHHESDDDAFLHGEMEDLHHETDRARRRRKGGHASPRKYHSPPPKRHASPAPRARARSPKPLFDRRSPPPRRMRSPAPKRMTTPNGSPDHGVHVKFNLAARPGLTTTKSLPRPGLLFSKPCRDLKQDTTEDDLHIRGAVDIVKGLERKRQRRKEKFHQKYCTRARRGQIPERKAMPGRGAERMKELGLLMAGKKDQGNYVLSI